MQGSFYISDNIFTDSRILRAYIIRDLFVVVLTDHLEMTTSRWWVPKNDHILKTQQPILQQKMVKLLTILFEH